MFSTSIIELSVTIICFYYATTLPLDVSL